MPVAKDSCPEYTADLALSRIMVFAPHPDDDVLGCGGSIVKHREKGRQVRVVFLTSGEAGSPVYQPGGLSRVREEEAAQALRILDVEEPVFLGLTDGGIEVNSGSLDLVVGLLRRERPDIIYLPHARDIHRDHLKTHELVLEACRRAAGPWHPQCGEQAWEVAWILAYEIWAPLNEVNMVEDISPYIDIKIEALRRHTSQLKHIAYDEGIRGLNRFRGVSSGRGDYCECFQVLKASV
ncbi:MAG: PIG-L deacetylase family protein [Syntrophomonas sp.]